MRDAGYRVVGIDISPKLIAVGRQKHPGLELVEGDVENLPFESDSLDAVLLSGLVHHFPDPRQCAAEVFRALKAARLCADLWGEAAMNRHPLATAQAEARDDSLEADLTVIGGAGHVGIPLVLAFAESGLKVNVNDINVDALGILKSGRLPFIEHGAEDLLAKALAAGRLIFTASPKEISPGMPVIITIGIRRVAGSFLSSWQSS